MCTLLLLFPLPSLSLSLSLTRVSVSTRRRSTESRSFIQKKRRKKEESGESFFLSLSRTAFSSETFSKIRRARPRHRGARISVNARDEAHGTRVGRRRRSGERERERESIENALDGEEGSNPWSALVGHDPFFGPILYTSYNL